jgi:hypothetical protein
VPNAPVAFRAEGRHGTVDIASVEKKGSRSKDIRWHVRHAFAALLARTGPTWKETRQRLADGCGAERREIRHVASSSVNG